MIARTPLNMKGYKKSRHVGEHIGRLCSTPLSRHIVVIKSQEGEGIGQDKEEQNVQEIKWTSDVAKPQGKKEKQNKKHDIDPLSNHESAANKNKNQKANDM